jgi:hypothetical protein
MSTVRPPAPTAAPSTARRAHRYRERQKRGIFAVNVPVKASGIELMIEAGWLAPDQCDNRDAVAKAVIRAANIGFAMPRGERHA